MWLGSKSTFALRCPFAAARNRSRQRRGEGPLRDAIAVGYRYFDQDKIEPLFPFGFGLSYTTFASSELKTTPTTDGLDVAFRVRNTGKLAGAEVAQVYLTRPPDAPLPMAPDTLAG